MKVLALGGSGDMGRMSVAILLEYPIVSSITVADKDYQKANLFVEMVGSNKLHAEEIDVRDNDLLVQLISRHDIVVNTVGPFYKFAKPILKACIEAKKFYVDICDDWKPTLDLLALGNEAEQAGITAIIGAGCSPGISNLMAVMACKELDQVNEIITAWGVGQSKTGKKPKYFIKPRKFYKKLKRKAPVANAAIMHFFYETIGKIPTFKDGKILEIESLSEGPPVQFPGYKEVYACHIGHPEPVTLPRVIKANSICNVAFLGRKPIEIVKKIRNKIASNELTIEQASIEMEKKMKRLLINPFILKEFINYPPETTVIATGLKENKRKKIALGCYRNAYGAMAGDTGVPLGIVAIMMIEGKFKKKGVFTPEEIIDPSEFFDRYAKYCGKDLSGEDILIKKIANL
jgi:saccharopine dehydrogenase-like NADP-dependent oxidoreductase